MAGHGGHSSSLPTMSGPEVDRGANIAAVLAFVVMLGFLAWLLFLTYTIAAHSPEPTSLWQEHPHELKHYYHDSDIAQGFGFAAALIAFAIYAWPRWSHQARIWTTAALVLAGVTVSLTLATYIPCAPEGNPVVPTLGWTLGIFEGDIEIAGPGARCALAFSPGFELARGLGIILVVWALSLVVRRLVWRRFEYWRTIASSDLDIVVGLDEVTLPLIKALAAERDARSLTSRAFDRRPGRTVPVGDLPGERAVAPPADVSRREYLLWRWTGLRRGDFWRRTRRPTKVAVIDHTGGDAFGQELRELGVRVLAVDPTSQPRLRELLINKRPLRPRQVALRRLFAVTADQQVNVRVYEQARAVLAERGVGKHVHDVVPRVVVRLEDEREARHWRLEQIAQHDGGVEFFADAITTEGVAAIQVADEIIDAQTWLPGADAVDHVMIVGEGSLGAILPDELAWQLWRRYEVALERWLRAESEDARDKAWEDLNVAAAPQLKSISLLGANASSRALEWERSRAPWRRPTLDPGVPGLRMFTIVDPARNESSWSEYEKLWEPVAEKALSSARTVLVLADASATARAVAIRLSKANREGLGDEVSRGKVLLRVNGSTSGRESIASGGVVRFSTGLTVPDTDGEPRVPLGWVGRLARQQHTAYIRQWSATEAAGPDGSQPLCRRLAREPWEQLPQFFRDDNIRQHWLLLNQFARWGRITTPGAAPASAVDSDRLDAIADDEAKRWADMRRDTGWWSVPKGLRCDALRLTDRPLLEPDVSENDLQAAQQILDRLWAIGYAPRSSDVSTG